MSAEPAAAVHRAVVLPVSRERAWDAVTDPDQLASWLADEVELDPRAGGAAAFRWDDGQARVGVVEECAERRRLAFRWWDADDASGEESLVELTLDDVEDGTRVTVVEVRTAALRAGDARLAPAGTPSPWAPRMAALTACFATAWA
jgi:uncharacterized protein YndB with AHSA1/START domain